MVEHSSGGVRAAALALASEHRELMQKLDRLAQTRELASLERQLAALLEELGEHFAREQYPGGLYEQIGLSSETHSDVLRELIDEHFAMLSRLHRLLALSRYAGQQGSTELLEKTADLVAQLKGHELKERALIQAALHG